MRRPFVAGNWKMNTTRSEAEKLVTEMKPPLEKVKRVDIVLCPPFPWLPGLAERLRGSELKLGAQNLYYAEKGAYTGEVSALMLQGICDYVILGHSERRQIFKESSELVSRKVAAAIGHHLRPILCVGEVLTEYEAGKTEEVVSEQLLSSLAGIDAIESVTIAYEPVWAIGSGKAASGQEANRTIALIRKLIARQYSSGLAETTCILYGGSVTAGNIAEFVSQSEIDGALVGGASLKAAEFVDIVKTTAEMRRG